MRQGIPDHLRLRLLTLLGARNAENADQDELNSVLLQLTLALMMIFMIAFFIFVTKVEGEITQIDSMKQTIAKAEEAVLMRAVERTCDRYRLRYGLREFMMIDPVTGVKSFEFGDVLRNGKLDRAGLAGNSFVTGAAAAVKDYRDLPALELEWMQVVRSLAGTAADRNLPLLRNLVHDGVLRVRAEVVEVQALAAAAMQEFLVRHPEQVDDRVIRLLLQRINRVPDSPERARLLRELAARLRNYVYNHLAARCGVQMLKAEKYE